MKISSYENFDNVNNAYSNFIQKFMEVIGKVAPVKIKRTKRNFRQWYGSEISEKQYKTYNARQTLQKTLKYVDFM